MEYCQQTLDVFLNGHCKAACGIDHHYECNTQVNLEAHSCMNVCGNFLNCKCRQNRGTLGVPGTMTINNDVLRLRDAFF